MFKTIKAKVTMYKWLIIFAVISLLALGLGVQYHKAVTLEIKTDELVKDNKTLTGNLAETNRQFVAYKKSTDKAMEDLQELRVTMAQISQQTSQLRDKVNGFKTTPVQPGGVNAKVLEDEANAVTRDVFNRIESTSRGKNR